MLTKTRQGAKLQFTSNSSLQLFQSTDFTKTTQSADVINYLVPNPYLDKQYLMDWH